MSGEGRGDKGMWFICPHPGLFLRLLKIWGIQGKDI